MRKVLILSVFTWLSVSMLAQPIGKSSYETMLATAAEQLEKKDYYQALQWYEKAYDEKKDRTLRPIIADLHYKLRDYVRAERAYRTLLRRDDENEFLEDRFYYGRVLKMNGNYDDAIAELQTFIANTNNDSLKALAQVEINGAELALALPETTKGVTVENLGRDVNGAYSEYSPYMSQDGNKLYFAGFPLEDKQEIIEIDEQNTDYHARIFAATKGDEGWTNPEPINVKVNRPGVHTTNPTLSPEGSKMYFTRATLEGNVIGQSKIYVSEMGADGWQGANEVVGVNGDDYNSKQAVPGELFGKEVLFFVSDMQGGYGGYDIYYATHEGEGVYADPVNLGAKINTVGDEETPYYRDGTLYFSSNGHPSLGGFDIFYAVWDGSFWSEPKNMGWGYNSGVDDQYFSIDKDGYSGFFTSNRIPERRNQSGGSAHGRTCCDDIYQFSIAKLYADLVVGVFTDQKKPLVGATVGLVPMVNDEPGEIDAQTKDKGNRFDYDLALEMPYMVVASKEGYYPDTFSFNTVGLKESKSFEHRFFLKAKPVPPPEPEYDTIEIEQAFVLENILYDFDDDRIREEAESDLKVVQELMQEYPEMKIELGSHTDNRGEDNYNEDLSQRRAESARRWLVRNGVSRDRIEAKGYGENQPQTVTEKVAAQNDFLNEGDVLTIGYIDSLETEEQKEVAHLLNRRTEFKIIEGPTSITIKRTRLKKKPSSKNAPEEKNSLPQAKPQHDSIAISTLSSLYGKKDLKGLPIMHFENRLVDFGKVKKGEIKEYAFEFTNVGDTPLEIAVVTACECTETDYPTKAIAPGAKGKIEIIFDSTEKEQSETVDVDIMLENSDKEGNPIMEAVQFKFELIE